MMRQRVGRKRCRPCYAHIHTETHTHRRADTQSHDAKPSSLLYYCGQLVSEGEQEGEEKTQRGRDEFVVTVWRTQLFNGALLFHHSPPPPL